MTVRLMQKGLLILILWTAETDWRIRMENYNSLSNVMNFTEVYDDLVSVVPLTNPCILILAKFYDKNFATTHG